MSRISERFKCRGSSPVIALTLLLGACGPPPVDFAEEETAVRAAWDELAASIEGEDWGAFASLWIQDPTVQILSPDQELWLKGWDDISAVYRDVVSNGSRLKFQTNSLEVSVGAAGRTAWAVGEVITTTAGSSEIDWQMAVLRKVGDSWKFATAFTGRVESGPQP